MRNFAHCHRESLGEAWFDISEVIAMEAVCTKEKDIVYIYLKSGLKLIYYQQSLESHGKGYLDPNEVMDDLVDTLGKKWFQSGLSTNSYLVDSDNGIFTHGEPQ